MLSKKTETIVEKKLYFLIMMKYKFLINKYEIYNIYNYNIYNNTYCSNRLFNFGRRRLYTKQKKESSIP